MGQHSLDVGGPPQKPTLQKDSLAGMGVGCGNFFSSADVAWWWYSPQKQAMRNMFSISWEKSPSDSIFIEEEAWEEDVGWIAVTIEGTRCAARRSGVGLPTSLIAPTQETLLVKARDLKSGWGNDGKVEHGNKSEQSPSSLLLTGGVNRGVHCTSSIHAR